MTETHDLVDVRDLQTVPLAHPVTTQWVEVVIRQTRPPTSAQKVPSPYAAISELG